MTFSDMKSLAIPSAVCNKLHLNKILITVKNKFDKFNIVRKNVNI